MGVGVPELDAEHQLIIAQINLLNLYRKSRPREAIQDCLSFLIDHAHNHFSHEELYLRMINYHRRDEHISRHREFISRLSEFQDALQDNNSVELVEQLTRFIAHWLDSHILTDDKDYAVAARAMG